ncbi:Nrap protein [Melampsora americana]|nr:Nrap protein [Melampsora americana]
MAIGKKQKNTFTIVATKDPITDDGPSMPEHEIRSQDMDVSYSKAPPKAITKPTYTETDLDDLVAACSPASGVTFPLQVSSLLESTSLPHDQSQELVDFLSTLRSHLLSIPTIEKTSLENSTKRLQKLGIGLPFEDPKETVQWSFTFKAPQDIKVVGSWIMKTGVKLAKGKGRSNCIDLMVEMPCDILQEKDYLSNRYFHKRAHYVACLAASLSTSSFAAHFDMTYVNLHNDASKPILLLKPKGAMPSPNFKPSIRLIPSYPSTIFPPARLSSNRANLKPSQKPSPRYNQSVLLDSTAIHFSHLSYFSELSTNHSAFVKTCRLMKVWARQRGFYHPSGVSLPNPPLVFGYERFGWLISFLVAHVLVGEDENGKKKGQPMSSVGSDATVLFRQVIDWIAKWKPNSLLRMRPIDGSSAFVDEGEFAGIGDVLVDPTGQINLLANMPSGALQLLQQAAMHSSTLLKSGYDVFDSLFLKPLMSFSCTFDYHFMVQLSSRDTERICQDSERKTTNDMIFAMSDTINKACGDRLCGFGFLIDHSQHPRSVDDVSNASTTQGNLYLKLGVILNPAQAFNIITHGHSPDTSPIEAAAFREFWGDKCDLRRFQDGAIEECVSWEVSDPLERLKIVQKIIRWVLEKKLGFANQKQQVISDFVGTFDDLIVEHPHYVEKIYEKDPKCLGFTNVIKAFNEFVKDLKELNKDDFLPLAITSVQPTSEHLRYSSVFIPGPRKMKGYRYQADASKYIPAMTCQLKFESSGKWPEDLEAIQKIKAALLAKISEGMIRNKHAIKSDIVFDPDVLPISDNVALEVLHSTGYAFVLSICYEREEMLLAKAMADSKAPDGSESNMALEATAIYRTKFIKLRKHHDAIAALQTRFPSFSYTVRIIKRWIASHSLSSQISTEMVELLASAVYLILEKDQLPPATGSTGFLRFLKMIEEWKWRDKPLLIPLQSSIGIGTSNLTHFPETHVKSVIKNFVSMRKKDPGFHHSTYFIVTEEDLNGTDWLWTNTKHHLNNVNQIRPHRIVADRIQTLASASLSVIESNFNQPTANFDVRMIFKSPAEDYDFHLVLNVAAMTRVQQSLQLQVYENVDPLGLSIEIGDDPISEFVKELQRLHGDTIMFFYDALGGTSIAGIFNPLLLVPKTMKTHNRDYLTKPISDQPTKTNLSTKALVVMDTDATLSSIKKIGTGIIHHILQKGVDY